MFKFMSILAKILSSKHRVTSDEVQEGLDSLIKTLTIAKTFSGEAVKLSDWMVGTNDKKIKEGDVNGLDC